VTESEHTCLTEILKDSIPEDLFFRTAVTAHDSELLTKGSSSLEEVRHQDGYAMVMLDKAIKAQALQIDTSTQKTEL
jgi:hypothetical protein